MYNLVDEIKILKMSINLLKVLFINFYFLGITNILLDDNINLIIECIQKIYTKVIIKNIKYKKIVDVIRIYFNKLITIINNLLNNNKNILINSSYKKEYFFVENNFIINKNITLYDIDKFFDTFLESINYLYKICKE
jgi:hypothetical protein